MRLLLVFFTLSVALLASGASQAERGHHRGDRQLEKLDLSDQQKQEIKAIQSAHKTDMKNRHQKMKSLRKNFREKMKANASDTELRSLFQELQNQKREAEDLRFETSLKIRSKLTDEQRAQFRVYAGEKRKERRGKRSQRNRSSDD